MAQHFVICKYCNQKFNRDIEPFVEVGARRYAHKSCAEQVEASTSPEEKDYNNLETYIKKLFNIKTINAKTKKQIRDFREEYGYSYSGMLKTLYWWYEIQDHTTELAKNGIGIIPYIYEDAEKYYYTLYLAKIVNDNIGEYKPKIEEIEIASPRTYVNPIKLFKIGEE